MSREYKSHYKKVSPDSVVIGYIFNTYEERIQAELDIMSNMENYLEETNRRATTRTLMTPFREFILEIKINK